MTPPNAGRTAPGRMVQDRLDVTHRTASQLVNRLVDEDILHPISGRVCNRQFLCQDIIDAFL